MVRVPLPLLLLLATASGCVTVYQPVTALQRPVTVDPSALNFEGLRLLVRCTPAEGADQGESEELCQNLSTLYSNQGAVVDTEVPDESGIGGVQRGGDEEEDPRAGKGAASKQPDLIIEMKARRVHGENSALLWAACIATATLIPAITEATYAQDVMIRDAEGFLLVSETLQARFIRYFGLAFWGINGLLDLIVRPKGEGLIGNNHNRDFSKDFHGQMSQLAFHAQMRARILQGFAAEPGEKKAPLKPKPDDLPPSPPPPPPPGAK